VIGAGINQDAGGGTDGAFEGTRDNGLVTGHAYSVTDAKEIHDFVLNPQSPPTRVRLIRVRNPWGNDVEWKGDWSDHSPLWQLLTPKQKQDVLGFGNDVEAPDGEFFMPYEEFVTNFDNIDICNMNPEEDSNDDGKG
jgi:calpain